MQVELEFTVHQRETSPESESYLYSGMETFSNNCKILFLAFMKGERFTSNNSPVGDFRRRICDLKENHVKLSFETNGRIKTWFMSENDKKENNKFNQ